MEIARGGGVGNEPQLGYIGVLVGLWSDSHCEEADALVLGVSHGRKDIRVPGMRDAVCHQYSHLDARWSRLLQVDPGEVGDGIGGVGAMANVGDGRDAGLEIRRAPPLLEGLFDDDVAAVLQEGGPGAEATPSLQTDTLQAVHHVGGKALLLGVVFLCTL